MPSSWLQLSVSADPSAFDALSNFLIERGSPGVVIRKREIQAFFASSTANGSIKKDVQRFVRGIRGIYPEDETPRLHWRVLKDRNWNRSWHRFFRPQKVGKAFWVTPPWTAPPVSRRRHVITVEPGMAFGTGTHATTRGCMEFIEEVAARLRGAKFTALDVGTGSGILAIALVKLGAKQVLALDRDPVALKVARENLRCNHVLENVRLSEATLIRVRRSFPVVVANLTAETIIDLAGPLKSKVAPKGFLILSGILNPKSQAVIDQLAADFKVMKRKREKEWLTLLLRRR
ncbi:MAG TPA: 50S ribosomal protein L11 methyltransferase [Candidatus Binatia bacterium]